MSKCTIQSRLLRHVCVLQKFISSGTDTRGQPSGRWDDIATVRVSIRPVGGRTAEYARQLYSEATHEIWMRYRSGVVRTNRLKMGNRKFTIGVVQNVDERSQWLKLTCKEDV